MNFIRTFTRAFSKIDLKSLPEHRSLVLDSYGEPLKNVALKIRQPEEVLPKGLGSKQVLVEHLAACVNPADINFIQGVYGIKVNLPTVLGLEGVTRVKSIGCEVSHLKPGDLALSVSLVGYWQSYSVQDESTLYKVDNSLSVTDATQLKVNPCTAYRMLKDFVDLKQGDSIIQNGANSAVGVYVIQLAKQRGIKTINVIRNRPNKDKLVEELQSYGADHVVTEEEVGNIEFMSPIMKKDGKPKLLLNCVGGKNANNCQRYLESGAHSVTYGVMSRQPFNVTGTSLIFKDHKYVGFWMSRWYQQREKNGRAEIETMLNETCNLFRKGVLKSKPTSIIDFESRDKAFDSGEFGNTKYIFRINS